MSGEEDENIKRITRGVKFTWKKTEGGNYDSTQPSQKEDEVVTLVLLNYF